MDRCEPNEFDAAYPCAAANPAIQQLKRESGKGTITNQGTIFYDTDANGANEASTGTDNPATPNANPDPTSFMVPVAPLIPTVNEIGLMLLALLLAMGGAWTLRRRQGDAFSNTPGGSSCGGGPCSSSGNRRRPAVAQPADS